MSKETGSTAAPPSASPQKQALLDAFDNVLKKQAEERDAERRDAEARRGGRSRVRPSIMLSAVLAVFLCAYLYIEHPDWLFPSSAPVESVAIREASLRIAMANAAQHVERYHQRTGRLPKTLADVGTEVAGIALPGARFGRLAHHRVPRGRRAHPRLARSARQVPRQQLRPDRPEIAVRRCRGFTFIEVLVTLVVLGILSSLALLKYIDLRHRALSASATADLQAVRLAAYSAWYEHGTWPPEVASGEIPAGLTQYLPGGFSFSRSEYTLDWDNFVPPGGGPSAGMQLGVVVTSSNQRLVKTLQNSLGNKQPFIVVGGNLTFVIVGPDGRI